MDFYLNTNNSFKRLMREYQDHGSLVVAYDFDNTVFDYHQKGHSCNKVITLLKALKKINCYLIVFTANTDLSFVRKYCVEHKIPFDAINENPPFFKSDSRKIYYNILLDDRAGLKECYDLLNQFLQLKRSSL